MGEVYRARDTKLDRDVAIKILPDAFAADVERVARFEREAKTLAALNHPNIAHIHGLEESGRVRALVMELVEGEDLSQRIARGAIPLDEALPIAKQIAEALEAAHEQGIIHRDLKPANVKVRPDGTVKVLDFGLAKAMEPVGAMSPNVSQSPTITSPALMTGAGMILGTAAYMSPEQAKGKPADARSDIWAFGIVLYEMLTGRSAFSGETMVEVLGGVVKVDPDWTALPHRTPPIMRSLLRRCLQRDRRSRLHAIADARLSIEEALNEPAIRAAPIPRERKWRAAAMLVVIAALTIPAAWYFRSAPADAPEMRLQIVTPPGSLTSFALSPDGRTLVFTAQGRLWLRPLESETAQPLAGTEGGTLPFWSPDSRSLGFFAGGQVKRIDLEGALVRTLATAPRGRGGAWNEEGTILFALSSSPVYRIPATGGTPLEVTRGESSEQANHRFPFFLPDGHHFLFFAQGSKETEGIYVGSLDPMAPRRLWHSDVAPAVFVPPDYVLFGRQGVLLAQRLDLETLEAVGDPMPVHGKLAANDGVLHAALSASATGVVAYRPEAGETQLVWLDRSGRQIGTLGGRDPGQPNSLRLSPDGQTVAVLRFVSGQSNLWLMDVARGLLRPFTFDGARDPAWSHDSKRLAFGTDRTGPLNISEAPVDGVGTQTLLLASSQNKNVNDWSPDERFILYANQTTEGGTDLWALPLLGDRKAFSLVPTAFEETAGRFSPVGGWIAYQSNESGRTEVWVQPFRGPGAKSQISTGGGTDPEWRRDGRELYLPVGRQRDGRLDRVEQYTGRRRHACGLVLDAAEVDGRIRSLIRRAAFPRQHHSRRGVRHHHPVQLETSRPVTPGRS